MKKSYLLNLLVLTAVSTFLTAQAQNFGQQQQLYNQIQPPQGQPINPTR